MDQRRRNKTRFSAKRAICFALVAVMLLGLVPLAVFAAEDSTYVDQIAALKQETLNCDGSTESCADIYDRLMAVYDEASTAWEADRITDDEMDAVDTATGEVIAVLNGYGYDPYATSLLAPGGNGGPGGTGGTGSYQLSMNDYQPTSAVYWQVMTGNSTSGYSMASDQSTITSVTLNSLNVVHCNSTSSWSGGNTLSNYYPGLSTGGTSTSKNLVVTPANGYYVTRVIVACTSQGTSSPYNCNTWKAENAYEKAFSVGTSGAVTISLPSEAFGHSSDSPTYFILIAVAPIPSPLYVEYDYGNIVSYMNTAGVDATVFTGSASTWTAAAPTTTTANSNYYGTGAVQTNYTQFKYAYSGDANASEAAKWSHYANTVTSDAKLASAEAGYYFTGWRAEYYTGIEVTPTSGSYNNYNYDFNEDTLYGTGTYAESQKVVLTTNVRLIAQWAPVEMTLTKEVTGLTGTDFAGNTNSYTLQLQKQNAAGEWVSYGDAVTLEVTGDGTASAKISPIVPGTYRAVETAGNTDLNDGSTVMYITVSAGGTAVVTAEAIASGTSGYELTVTNSYSASAPAIKLVKLWQDAEGNTLDGNDSRLPASVTMTVTDGTKTESYTLTKEGGWVTYVNVADYSGTLTVTESAINGFQLVGIQQSTITGEEITVDGTKCYCTVAYTATNRQSTTDVTISKTVGGNMGDLAKDFTFTVKLSQPITAVPEGAAYTVSEDGKTVTFTLTHNQSVTIANVPVGATIEVSEESSKYEVLINGEADDDGIYTATVTNGMDTIAYKNVLNVTIDTGFTADVLPFVLLLAIVAGAAFVCRKRFF